MTAGEWFCGQEVLQPRRLVSFIFSLCVLLNSGPLSCSPSWRFKTSKKNELFDEYVLESPQSEQFVGSHFDEVGGV